MPQLLLEILSEEIPARMQARAEADLARMLTDRLRDGGLGFGEVRSWSGPRRLGVCVERLDARASDVREERKGPKVGAPEAAIAGFLRAAGLSDIAQAQIVSDPKKGDFYVAMIERPGRDAAEIIAQAVPALMAAFAWPKSMTSGYESFRWVRPLSRIVCVLDGQVVPFAVGGIVSGDLTEGHRVHGPGPFTVTGWEDYRRQLEGKGKVRLTRAARKALILKEAMAACAARGLELVPDEGLLEEVTGLAEWPVVILGDMDPAFLDLPGEVIRLSMRTHQKYFAVRDPKTGGLAPHFVVVANLKARDGGALIAAGNARVLSARLNDARFFWDGDRARGLEAMAPKLASIAFKEELGSMADKVERVAALAREIAPFVGADPDLCERAARLCKADLVSGMVGEFPELQGVMGRYYALNAGEDAAVADAIRDHYRPQGPSDAVPTAPVSIALALADKIDTLTGFWAIGEKPTGSGDPYALRRAALGVIRIVLENGVRVSLDRLNDAQGLIHQTRLRHGASAPDWSQPLLRELHGAIIQGGVFGDAAQGLLARFGAPAPEWTRMVSEHDPSLSDDLLSFLHERMKVYLREASVRHDHIDACLAMPETCDLVLLQKRVEALQAFLSTEAGAALLSGYRRAANILKAEEKKGWAAGEGEVADPARFVAGPEGELERELHVAIGTAVRLSDAALQREDFVAAMSALSDLRGPVDRFFEGLQVNAPEASVRHNRLVLLTAIRQALERVADFAKIEG